MSEEEELRRWREGLDTALRKRSWARRLLRAFTVSLVLVLLAAGAGAAYFWKDIERRIRRVGVGELTAASGGTRNILVIGTDSRAFVDTAEDARKFGRVGGRRADTVMLVQAVPSERRAVLLSFPRDLWVPIAGDGMGKITTSFEHGPEAVIQTIQDLTGIPVNHYVQVDFNGFRHLVDAVGGIDVCLDKAMRDSVLRFRLGAGPHHLDGDSALTFVRSRHSDADGDFGRIRRQQQFLRAVVSKIGKPSVLLNPIRMHGLAGAFAENVTTDREFRMTDMLRLAKNVREVSPDQMQTYTVPGDIGRAGSQSVVRMDRQKAEPLFQALRDGQDPAEALAPKPVQVVVQDASGRGVGERVAADLRARGFEVAGVVEAPAVQTRTTVMSPRSSANDARRVLSVVSGARLAYGGTSITLVVGTNYRGLVQAPKGEAPQPGGPCVGFDPGR